MADVRIQALQESWRKYFLINKVPFVIDQSQPFLY